MDRAAPFVQKKKGSLRLPSTMLSSSAAYLQAPRGPQLGCGPPRMPP